MMSYASVADFVDEGEFLGRLLAQTRIDGTATTNYRYDAQRRVVGWSTSRGSVSENATVIGWDARNRFRFVEPVGLGWIRYCHV